MVISLGNRPHNSLPIQQHFRILQGQQLHLRYQSDAVCTVRAWARVIYDDGEDSLLTIPETVLAGDRVEYDLRPSEVATKNGWVCDAVVEMLTTGIERGQTYVRLGLEPFGTLLANDYCYSGMGQVAAGTHSRPGPDGGVGHLELITVKSDGAPAASTTYALAISNTVRRIHEWVWYYNASADVATRVLNSTIANPLGALPTGFASVAKSEVWETANLSLTASEEGTLFVDPDRSGRNDDSTLTIDDGAANPSPFPLLVRADDPVDLIWRVTDGEVLDADVIYLFAETWVVP